MSDFSGTVDGYTTDKYIDITFYEDGGCPRCRTYHGRLIARRMRYPIIGDDEVWTHWALCPVSGDPVLVTVTVDEDEDA